MAAKGSGDGITRQRLTIVRGGLGHGASGGGGHTGGEPPGDDELEKRVEKLESTAAEVQVRLVRIETRLESIATKADLQEMAAGIHKSMNEQTWKFLGGATGMAALFAAIAFGLSRALSGN